MKRWAPGLALKKRPQVISEMAHYYSKQSACPTGQQAGEHKAHNWTSLLKSGLLLNQSEGLLLPSIVLILMGPKFHLATCNLMAHDWYSKINSNEEEEQCSKKLTLFNYQHSCIILETLNIILTSKEKRMWTLLHAFWVLFWTPFFCIQRKQTS